MPYTAKWIPLLAKAAGRSTAGLYYIFNKRGYTAPYTSELRGLTILRGMGLRCKGYKPTEDAVGKPMPPLIPKGSKKAKEARQRIADASPPNAANKGTGTWTDKLLLTRLAKLLPDGATTNNKNRIRYYLKQAGYKDVRKMKESDALDVLQRRQIAIKGFEYENAAPGNTAPTDGDIPQTYKLLLVHYNELLERSKESAAFLQEREAKIAALIKTRSAVRAILLQYQHRHPLIVAKSPEELSAALNYPLTALHLIRED